MADQENKKDEEKEAPVVLFKKKDDGPKPILDVDRPTIQMPVRSDKKEKPPKAKLEIPE